MEDKNRSHLIHIFSLVSCVLGILVSVLCLLPEVRNMDRIYIFIVILLIATIVSELTTIFTLKLKTNSTKEAYKLDKLMKYNKKRKELEEEINLLTKELMKSDLSQYLDVNGLVFKGQNAIERNESINYSAFLKQFGLQNDEIEIRKNSAVFLTPFTEDGEILFRKCQRTLGDIDIFLQKTDNIVEKEDILMNIVSLIVQSEIVIVNINGRNPNVYYELGIAHAIGKPTILLSHVEFDENKIAFDIRQKRVIMYRSWDDLERQLLYQVSRLQMQGVMESSKKERLLENM